MNDLQGLLDGRWILGIDLQRLDLSHHLLRVRTILISEFLQLLFGHSPQAFLGRSQDRRGRGQRNDVAIGAGSNVVLLGIRIIDDGGLRWRRDGEGQLAHLGRDLFRQVRRHRLDDWCDAQRFRLRDLGDLLGHDVQGVPIEHPVALVRVVHGIQRRLHLVPVRLHEAAAVPLAQNVHRGLELAGLHVVAAEAQPGRFVVGIDLEGRFIGRLGQIVPPHIEVRVAQVGRVFRALAVQRDGLTQNRRRVVVVLQQEERIAEVIQQGRRVRESLHLPCGQSGNRILVRALGQHRDEGSRKMTDRIVGELRRDPGREQGHILLLMRVERGDVGRVGVGGDLEGFLTSILIGRTGRRDG